MLWSPQHRDPNQLIDISSSEFLFYAPDKGLDAFRAEAQLCSYFGRGHALSEKSEHFSLTPARALFCRVITFHDDLS
jgi:hypothetical protein